MTRRPARCPRCGKRIRTRGGVHQCIKSDAQLFGRCERCGDRARSGHRCPRSVSPGGWQHCPTVDGQQIKLDCPDCGQVQFTRQPHDQYGTTTLHCTHCGESRRLLLTGWTTGRLRYDTRDIDPHHT